MGRGLSLPAFVATLVSTWYGGIMGVSEYTYTYGISNWIVFGFPYYVFATLFALFVARSARRSSVVTIPELLTKHYGERAGLLGALWVLVLGSPAPYVLTVGFLISYFFEVSLPLALLVGTLFSTIYILRGGFRSVVRTDLLQFMLMFTGFIVLFIVLMLKQGSPVALWSELPDGHRQYDGGQGFGYILVWFFIASMTLIDPGFHQRTYATRDPATARKGILAAIAFWFFFDLLTTFTGLYAVALLPADTQPSLAFIDLAVRMLPAGVLGLFLIGLLATVMSTLDSNALVSGMTLGHDLMRRIPRLARYSSKSLTRFGVVITMLLAAGIAWRIPSVVDLWYSFGTIAIPAMLIPVLWAYHPRTPSVPGVITVNLVLAPACSILWWIFARNADGSFYLGLQPFYPGMIMSILLFTYAYLNNARKGVK